MPVSTSRAMSGAPKKIPMSAGVTIAMSGRACCNGLSTVSTGFVAEEQFLAARQAF